MSDKSKIDATQVIFKPIPNYEGDYKVSNTGQVMSFKLSRAGRVLKSNPNSYGYPSVGLSMNGKQSTVAVHILVALAFLGKRPDGFDINHIDGDKANNHVSNLEYCTRSQNIEHAYSIGLNDATGENCRNAKLTEEEVNQIREEYKSGGVTYQELSDRYGVTVVSIGRIINRKSWAHI